MVTNTKTTRFLKPLSLSIVVAVAGGWDSIAWSQIVNSAAFPSAPPSAALSALTPEKPTDHSILIGPNDPQEQPGHANHALTGQSSIARPGVDSAASSPVLTDSVNSGAFRRSAQIAGADANQRAGFGANLAPLPRPSGDAGLKWSASPADPSSAARLQTAVDVTGSSNDFDPPTAPKPSPSNATPRGSATRGSAVGSTFAGQFGTPGAERFENDTFSSPSTAAKTPSGQHLQSHALTTATDTGLHSNGTASVFDQSHDDSDRHPEPAYQSAYLHDQQPRPAITGSPTAGQTPRWDANTVASTPVADTSGSPATTPRLTPPHRAMESYGVSDRDLNSRIQQTAYTRPASPLQPQQFQNNSAQRNNRRSFGQPTAAGQPPQTQRQSPDPQTNPTSQQKPNQTDPASASESASESAKTVIAKFDFDINQSSADGLPIRLIDVLRQSRSASRNQLIPQYWDVYYDWAQAISAANHRDWVASITAVQQTDAPSIEVAKSSSENEITFNSIQLTKSQAKMKSLMATTDPIVPLNNPTVTRVKTNYEAFKKHGLISPRFEGIDQTLNQMYGLIASRAQTALMAQQNADQAKQLYARNQSTVDHVLTAGRTWRKAESDFIASVIEYNQAYADYALALPYGNGPVESVIGMLIVETTPQNATNKNDAPSTGKQPDSSSQRAATTNDLSIPYRSAGDGQRQSDAASNRFTQRATDNRPQQASTSQSITRHTPGFGNRQRSGSNSGNDQSQEFAPSANSGFSSNSGFSPAASSGGASPASPASRLNQRPSQFPTGNNNPNLNPNKTAGSTADFSAQPQPQPQSQSQSQSFSPFAPANKRPNHSLPPNQKPFPGQTPPGDRTARRSSPFGSVSGPSAANAGGSDSRTTSATLTPSTQPSQPKTPTPSNFDFGG